MAGAHLRERGGEGVDVEAPDAGDGLLVGQVMHHHAEARHALRFGQCGDGRPRPRGQPERQHRERAKQGACAVRHGVALASDASPRFSLR
ncbi:hypothetical protein D3C71_391580 [compost metagenome]